LGGVRRNETRPRRIASGERDGRKSTSLRGVGESEEGEGYPHDRSMTGAGGVRKVASRESSVSNRNELLALLLPERGVQSSFTSRGADGPSSKPR